MTPHAQLARMEPVESPDYFAPEPTEAEEIAAERQHYRLEIWRKDQRIKEQNETIAKLRAKIARMERAS